ncbi:MAG: glycosyl hydrolase [Candidatus Dormibacteria bacterium]
MALLLFVFALAPLGSGLVSGAQLGARTGVDLGAWALDSARSVTLGALGHPRPIPAARASAFVPPVHEISPPRPESSLVIDRARALGLTSMVRPHGAPEVSPIYTLDAFGGVHPVNGAPELQVSGYWPGWDFARALALFQGGGGGYVLDAYGGLHPVGDAPYAAPSDRWPDFDIARSVALLPDSTSGQPAGYVLDGYGGLHPFGGALPVTAPHYWPGWDIARELVLAPWSDHDHPAGWVLDGWGGTHAFGGAPDLNTSLTWTFDAARSLAVFPSSTPDNVSGYVLDLHGGIHPVNGAPTVSIDGYWAGQDIARSLVLTPGSVAQLPGGYVVDGLGHYHVFGTGPVVTQSMSWNWDAARGAAGGGSGSSGQPHDVVGHGAPWNGHRPEFYGLVASGVAGPNSNQQAISVSQATGARSVRTEFLWTDLEQQKGQWSWDLADESVQQFDAAGLDVLGILDYNNPLYGGGIHDYPHDPNAFLNYVTQVVTRYHGVVRSWEIWNEENASAFYASGPNPCQYAALLTASYQRIKAIDPSLTVVMGGTSGVDVTYIRRVMGCGGRADVIAVHPYEGSPQDGRLYAAIASLGSPVWITEFGFQSAQAGDTQQAQWLQQVYLEAAGTPNVQRAYWYNYQDVNWSADTFGLRRVDGSSKPALATYFSLPKG